MSSSEDSPRTGEEDLSTSTDSEGEHETPRGRRLTREERERRRREDRTRLAREPGNGGGDWIDDVIDNEATEPVGATDDARTTFRGRETNSEGILRSDGTRITYERLWSIQHDNNSSTTEPAKYKNDEKNARRSDLIRIVATQLGITDHQRRRAQHLFELTDMSEIGRLSEEEIALASIHVALEDECDRMMVWSSDPLHDDFMDLLNDFDLLREDGTTRSKFSEARRRVNEVLAENE